MLKEIKLYKVMRYICVIRGEIEKTNYVQKKRFIRIFFAKY